MIRTTTTISKPPFVVDHKSAMRDTGRQIDWDAVLDDKYRHGAFAVTADGAVAVNDVEMGVDALERAIPAGTALYFGGSKKFVRLTAAAAAGAVSLTIEAAPTIIADNDVAYTGGYGGRFLPAGTIVDLLSSGKVVPSALGTSGVTAYGVLETNAEENSKTDSMTGYGVLTQCQIYENLLPESTGSPKVANSTHKTELIARGGAWLFIQYSDTTA